MVDPRPAAKVVTVALIGLGNVNRNFLKILETKAARLEAQYGLTFRVVAVADRSGVAYCPDGFDPGVVRRFKEQAGTAGQLSAAKHFPSPAAALAEIDADLLIEASPVNLDTGEPGLSATRAALGRGINVVLANKGPLVLAFHELHRLAAEHRAGLAFSATVCGALPVVNLGQRDFVAADFDRLRGIFNGTTNYILGEMDKGRSYADALLDAQRAGIAETDPRLDVEGWDTANKLVIIANSFLGIAATLADVTVAGITEVSAGDLGAAAARGQTIKLLATAERAPSGYRLTVAPTAVPKASFMGSCNGFEMGIEIATDLYGVQSYKSLESDALPTAAAMLRDAVRLCR